MTFTLVTGSVLDSLQDLSSIAFAAAAFAGLFLVLKGLDRVR